MALNPSNSSNLDQLALKGLNDFQNDFIVRIGRKFVTILIIKDLTTPQVCRYTTL